ncbi:MAG TPA: transglutaminase domain-containing protein [Mycobacteriales bacterium]|nr:transglutaminase domain-containing protein [Mycobacteriales bacterium]
MTTTLDAPLRDAASSNPASSNPASLMPGDLAELDKPQPDLPDAPDNDAIDEDELSPVTASLVAVSGALSALGAAWMVGGMFRGPEARIVAIVGVVLGGGLSFAATRWRASLLQYLVLPAALLTGAGLMAGSSGAGTSSLPALVKDAATTSQVLQPPIDFAPGWRLILVVVLALVTAAASALALSLRRTRLAVAVPVPLTVAAALVQPNGSAIATSAVSVGFVVMALATSYAADGVGDSFDVGFEVRRLGRSAVAGVLLVAALILASKASFLFPDDTSHHVVPPRKPPISPPPKDVPLYTVRGPLTSPLRVGVIDVYDAKQQAWLLPPVDNQRLQRLDLPAAVPDAPTATTGTPSHVTITIDQATGHILPALAGTTAIGGDTSVDYDPRTQTLALPSRPVFTGLSYTLTVPPSPTGAQLSAASGRVPDAEKQFLDAPPAPPAVQDVLAKAPNGTFARLQYVRAALYKHFTAVGEGKPTDVSAARVAQLLKGGTGNPYELTASEALLARWAGIPARMGYGYYNGQKQKDGSVQFRPMNAATYLEVYVAPYGWLPIIGTPPHAQESLSNNQQRTNTQIKASPDLGLQLLLPVRVPDVIPFYAYVRYYALRALPIVAGAGLLLLLYPVALKRVRRRRRAAWAVANGPAGAVAVAYCELRDRLLDLALPGRGATPLELVELVEEDEEHAELAWLVTRGLWGDLRGKLTDVDAKFARQLAESVGTRISKAQPETARLLAAVARASLRQPYSRELPNVWLQLRLPRPRLRGALRRVRPAHAMSLLALLAILFTAGCSGPGTAKAEAPVPFPTRIAPPVVAGLTVHDEPKADRAYTTGAKDRNVIVGRGKVVSFSGDGLIQAALQIGQFKPGYSTTDPQVVKAITASLATDATVQPLRREGAHELFGSTQGSQRIYLWFPTTQSMALLVVRAQITAGAAEALARALIDYGDGGTIQEAALKAAFDNPAPELAPTPTTSVTSSATPTLRPSAAPTPKATP